MPRLTDEKLNTRSLPKIRRARLEDFEGIWKIFRAIARTGDTYAYAPNITKARAKQAWMSTGIRTYVATLDARVVGTYILKPNQPSLGSHVANAAFMVDPKTSAKGIGTQMGRHALSEAKSIGYRAMQFNYVISTNVRAVRLWKRLGFSVIGVAPRAFLHSGRGYVDVYIMHRFL